MQLTKQFVTCGNAKFTISNGKTTFAYQVKLSYQDSAANKLGMFLVYGYSDRRLYIGRLNAYTGLVTRGRSRVTESSLMFQVIRWTCNVLWLGNEFPAGYQAVVC